MEDVQGSSVLGVNNPRRELSGGNFPRWDLCRGQFSGGIIVCGTIVLGGNFSGGLSGGNCPVPIYTL